MSRSGIYKDARDVVDEQQSDIFNLEAKLVEATKREEKLREALEFYADFANNTTMDGAYCKGGEFDSDEDLGKIAKQALQHED